MPLPRLIALDADDTLWHNETFFRDAHDRFVTALAPWADAAAVEHALRQVEGRNLSVYGYGAKGHTLSMLETALDLGGDDLAAATVAEVLGIGRDLMRHPVAPLDGVDAALARLKAIAPLVLVTKGDLFHQETKLAASGLGSHFAGVDIVSEKTPDTYRRVCERHGVAPADLLMAGNSVRSDVLPALEAGCRAVLVPYPLVWAHEAATAPFDHPRFHLCDSLAAMADWLERDADAIP